MQPGAGPNSFGSLLRPDRLNASGGILGAPPYAAIENNAEKRKEYAE